MRKILFVFFSLHTSIGFASEYEVQRMNKEYSICINGNPQDAEILGWPLGKDAGYRYIQKDRKKRGECLNSRGQQGYNPNCVGECGDLRGFHFTGVRNNLKWQKLRGANLSRVNMGGATLEYANLEGAILDLANLKHARLKATNIRFVSAVGTNFEDILFASSDGSFGDFRHANLKRIWWYQSPLWDADLCGADLSIPDDFNYAHRCGMGEESSCFLRAKYNSETIFPSVNFKPQNWGMLEVNE